MSFFSKQNSSEYVNAYSYDQLKTRQFRGSLLSAAIASTFFLILCLITTFTIRHMLLDDKNGSELITSFTSKYNHLYIAVGIASFVLIISNLIFVFFRKIPKISTSVFAFLIDSISLSIIIGFISLYVGYKTLLVAVGLSTLIYLIIGIGGYFLSTKASNVLKSIYTVLTITVIVALIIMLVLNFTVFKDNGTILIIQVVISTLMIIIIGISIALNINSIRKQELVEDQKLANRSMAWNGFILYQSYSRLLYYLLILISYIRRLF